MAFELSYVETGNIEYLAPEGLLETESILIAFTTRIGGVSPPPYNTLNLAFHVGDKQENVVKNREALCESLDLDLPTLTTAQQIHGDKITIVDRNNVGRGAISYDDAVPGTDALVTNLRRAPLALFFADCLPVVLVDTLRQVVAVVHTGRKGTELGVVSRTVELIKEAFDCKPQHLLAFIGPAIGPCCYEIDLLSLNQRLLEEAGVSRNNIFSVDICTSCDTDMFFSYRAENKKTGRQTALVTLI